MLLLRVSLTDLSTRDGVSGVPLNLYSGNNALAVFS